MKEFPERLGTHELKIPAILLLQSPLSGISLPCTRLMIDVPRPTLHGRECEYLSAISDAIKTISPPMIFLSTSPQMLDPNHAKCLSHLYNILLSNSYEFRFAIYDSASFGTLHETRKAILFASRIGLRDLPGKLNISYSDT